LFSCSLWRHTSSLHSTLYKRRVCFVHLQDEMKKIRDETHLLHDRRKCNGFAAGNIAKLVSCVNEVKERHELMTASGEHNRARGVGTKNIHAIIKAGSGEDALAEREVEAAVGEIRDRLERLGGQWSSCKTRKTFAVRVGGRQAVAKQREEARVERT